MVGLEPMSRRVPVREDDFGLRKQFSSHDQAFSDSVQLPCLPSRFQGILPSLFGLSAFLTTKVCLSLIPIALRVVEHWSLMRERTWAWSGNQAEPWAAKRTVFVFIRGFFLESPSFQEAASTSLFSSDYFDGSRHGTFGVYAEYPKSTNRERAHEQASHSCSGPGFFSPNSATMLALMCFFLALPCPVMIFFR